MVSVLPDKSIFIKVMLLFFLLEKGKTQVQTGRYRLENK